MGVINEDDVHAADVNGNGDVKVAQERPVQRQRVNPPTSYRELNG